MEINGVYFDYNFKVTEIFIYGDHKYHPIDIYFKQSINNLCIYLWCVKKNWCQENGVELFKGSFVNFMVGECGIDTNES